jgi:O-antigen/teichoic acid export membrane protein
LKIKKYFGLAENFISYFLFKAIDAIIPLVVVTYLLDVVSLKNYGIYAFAYSLIYYFQNVIQFGFDLSAVRTISLIREDKKQLSKVYSDVLTSQVYLFLLSFMVLGLLILFVPIIAKNYIVYCFFFILLFGELLFPMWFFLGMEKMRFMTIVNVISKSTFAILCFLLVKTKNQFIFISLYHSIGFLLSGISAQIIVYRTFGIRFKFSKFSEVKLTIKDSWSAFLSVISPTIYQNTSIFLVGAYGLPSYSGILEIGTKVLGAFKLVITIMTNVLFPYLNRNQSALQSSRNIFLGFGLMLSVIMFFSSEYLINLWLGENGTEVIKVVKYLSPCPFLSSVIAAYGINGLMILKKDKLYSQLIFTGSFSGLLVALIFIPKYHYIGGAYTIITALSVIALLVSIYYMKITNQVKNT